MNYDFHSFRLNTSLRSSFKVLVFKDISYVGYFSHVIEFAITFRLIKKSSFIGQWKVKKLKK